MNRKENAPKKQARNPHLLDFIQIGDEIEVWWPDDKTYYAGRITRALPNNRHRVKYDDGEVEDLKLETEQWRFLGDAGTRVQSLIKSRSTSRASHQQDNQSHSNSHSRSNSHSHSHFKAERHQDESTSRTRQDKLQSERLLPLKNHQTSHSQDSVDGDTDAASNKVTRDIDTANAVETEGNVVPDVDENGSILENIDEEVIPETDGNGGRVENSNVRNNQIEGYKKSTKGRDPASSGKSKPNFVQDSTHYPDAERPPISTTPISSTSKTVARSKLKPDARTKSSLRTQADESIEDDIDVDAEMEVDVINDTTSLQEGEHDIKTNVDKTNIAGGNTIRSGNGIDRDDAENLFEFNATFEAPRNKDVHGRGKENSKRRDVPQEKVNSIITHGTSDDSAPVESDVISPAPTSTSSKTVARTKSRPKVRSKLSSTGTVETTPKQNSRSLSKGSLSGNSVSKRASQTQTSQLNPTSSVNSAMLQPTVPPTSLSQKLKQRTKLKNSGGSSDGSNNNTRRLTVGAKEPVSFASISTSKGKANSTSIHQDDGKVPDSDHPTLDVVQAVEQKKNLRQHPRKPRNEPALTRLHSQQTNQRQSTSPSPSVAPIKPNSMPPLDPNISTTATLNLAVAALSKGKAIANIQLATPPKKQDFHNRSVPMAPRKTGLRPMMSKETKVDDTGSDSPSASTQARPRIAEEPTTSIQPNSTYLSSGGNQTTSQKGLMKTCEPKTVQPPTATPVVNPIPIASLLGPGSASPSPSPSLDPQLSHKGQGSLSSPLTGVDSNGRTAVGGSKSPKRRSKFPLGPGSNTATNSLKPSSNDCTPDAHIRTNDVAKGSSKGFPTPTSKNSSATPTSFVLKSRTDLKDGPRGSLLIAPPARGLTPISTPGSTPGSSSSGVGVNNNLIQKRPKIFIKQPAQQSQDQHPVQGKVVSSMGVTQQSRPTFKKRSYVRKDRKIESSLSSDEKPKLSKANTSSPVQGAVTHSVNVATPNLPVTAAAPTLTEEDFQNDDDLPLVAPDVDMISKGTNSKQIPPIETQPKSAPVEMSSNLALSKNLPASRATTANKSAVAKTKAATELALNDSVSPAISSDQKVSGTLEQHGKRRANAENVSLSKRRRTDEEQIDSVNAGKEVALKLTADNSAAVASSASLLVATAQQAVPGRVARPSTPASSATAHRSAKTANLPDISMPTVPKRPRAQSLGGTGANSLPAVSAARPVARGPSVHQVQLEQPARPSSAATPVAGANAPAVGGAVRNPPNNRRGHSLVTQNVERGTASLPLDILMRTITESNKYVLTNKLGPLQQRMDRHFSSNDEKFSSITRKIDGMDINSVKNIISNMSTRLEALTSAITTVREDVARMTLHVKNVEGILQTLPQKLEERWKADLSRHEAAVECQFKKHDTNFEQFSNESKNNTKMHFDNMRSYLQELCLQMHKESFALTSDLMQDSLDQLYERDDNLVRRDRTVNENVGDDCRGIANLKAGNECNDDLIGSEPSVLLHPRTVSEKVAQKSSISFKQSGSPHQTVKQNSQGGSQSRETDPKLYAQRTTESDEVTGNTQKTVDNKAAYSEHPVDNSQQQELDKPIATELAERDLGSPSSSGEDASINVAAATVAAAVAVGVADVSNDLDTKGKDTQSQVQVNDRMGSGNRDESTSKSTTISKELESTVFVLANGDVFDRSCKAATNKGPKTNSKSIQKSDAPKDQGKKPGHKAAPEAQKEEVENSNETVRKMGRQVVGSAVVKWMLDSGCRSFAPLPEVEEKDGVSVQWVRECCERCLKHVRTTLRKYVKFADAMLDLSHQLKDKTEDVQLDWLLTSPVTEEYVQKARRNYIQWEPPLLDYEWKSDQKVLRQIAYSVQAAEQKALELANKDAAKAKAVFSDAAGEAANIDIDGLLMARHVVDVALGG